MRNLRTFCGKAGETMAVIHFINSKKAQTAVGMKAVLNYTMQDKKTVADGKKFVSGVNCMAETSLAEFQNTKRLFHKETGRQYYHFVQSFAPGEAVTPELAHEIALRFASESKKLKGFEIVVSTHCDRDHIHSHFVMNSVNSETGKKFHISEREIDLLMQESDQLVQQYGLTVVSPQPKQQKKNSLSAREYRSAYKGQSWKSRLMFAIDQAMRYADDRAEFIELMEQQGYQVKWTRDRKYITYTTPEGVRCRDSKLHEDKYLKENMQAEFRIRVDVFEDIIETGWERERRRYFESVFEDEETSVVDIAEEFADPDDLVVEAGFLVADLSNIIDDDRKIEDSTTMRRPRKQKKNEQDHGPAMG